MRAKRIIVSWLLASVVFVGGAGIAVADKGGTPNQNACFGQFVKSFATEGGVGELASYEAQNDPGPGASAETHEAQSCKGD